NVERHDTVQGFNYQFLIDAFASETEEPEDTTSSDLPEIKIGKINFSDFDLHYDDAVTGMEGRVHLGQFSVIGKDLDLNEMRYEIDQISLKNTQLSYVQTKAFAEDKPEDKGTEPGDTTASVLPFLRIGKIKLSHVTAYYKSEPDGIEA